MSTTRFMQAIEREQDEARQRQAIRLWPKGLGASLGLGELELLDTRLLEVLRSAEVLSRERDARGVARAGDAEDLADDMRTWRSAGCPVLREVAKHAPERCRECQATRDWIKELGHHQLNIPPDPYRRCPQACSCEPQHFSIAECEAGD